MKKIVITGGRNTGRRYMQELYNLSIELIESQRMFYLVNRNYVDKYVNNKRDDK